MVRISRNRVLSLSPRSPQRLAGASESAGEDILAALEAFASLSQRNVLLGYLPAGRQVGKKTRSNTLPRLILVGFV